MNIVTANARRITRIHGATIARAWAIIEQSAIVAAMFFVIAVGVCSFAHLATYGTLTHADGRE